METKHKALFKPFKINNLEIKNRYTMAAMGATPNNVDGSYTDDSMEYFIRRARGGTGLLITGANWCDNEVEKHIPKFFASPADHPHEYIEKASLMTEKIHSYGSKIFMQVTLGLGRSAIPHLIVGGDFVAPSATTNRWDPRIQCRELTTEEVEHLVKRMADAAEVAKKAGFDGVEVHAMHEGYLLDCFTIAHFNKRTDKYGGDTRGRLTLPIEILQAIKERCGQDFPVMLRFGVKSYIKAERQGAVPGEDFIEIGRDLDESLEMAKILEEAGYDAFNVDAGSYDSWYWAHPPMYFGKKVYLSFAEQVKAIVNVPVICAGRIDNPDDGAEAIEKGLIDGVALARPLLADPDLPNKIRHSKPETVRPCLSCHDGCITRKLAEEKEGCACAVNPESMRELRVGIKPATTKRKVCIVGGGVGGMEAARVSALRGHEVVLFEATNALGGSVKVAGAPDFKEDDRLLITWYERELQELNVKVVLNKKVTKDEVLAEKADVVFVATGAKPINLKINGMEKEIVTEATKVLLKEKEVGNNVVVVGGGLVGCELSLWLAQGGKKVTIVEKLPDILKSGVPLPPMNDWALRDLLAFNKVDILTESEVVEVLDNGLSIKKDGKITNLEADDVVFAIGFKEDNTLYNELVLEADEVYNIGDSNKVVNIRAAIWDAYEVATHI